MRSQSPLAIYPSTGLLERWTHVGGDGFYTAVGESRKYDLETQSGWGQQKLHRMESREGQDKREHLNVVSSKRKMEYFIRVLDGGVS